MRRVDRSTLSAQMLGAPELDCFSGHGQGNYKAKIGTFQYARLCLQAGGEHGLCVQPVSVSLHRGGIQPAGQQRSFDQCVGAYRRQWLTVSRVERRGCDRFCGVLFEASLYQERDKILVI